MENIINPKVFISYSHDSEKHKLWVLKLSTHLRKHGVDVILDQWDARLGDDLPFFMEQGLSSSNLVLCVCSDKYVEKSNANKGGSGYEKKILSADLMKDSSQNYIIPIKRNNTKNELPMFLSGTLYLDFENDSKYYDDYEKLLARIYDEDIKIKPALGENPYKSDAISRTISYDIDAKSIQYINPLFEGNASFDYTRNNGLYEIGAGEYKFITYWSTAGMGAIHCYRDKVKRLGYNPNFTNYPSLDKIKEFDFSSRCKIIEEGQFVILENNYCKFVAIKVITVFRNTVDINHKLEFEYKIYSGLE
ncbi:MAG: toll/interleukin-1 receptor domain-containing protein [Anaerovoracaceae bacterium]